LNIWWKDSLSQRYTGPARFPSAHRADTADPKTGQPGSPRAGPGRPCRVCARARCACVYVISIYACVCVHMWWRGARHHRVLPMACAIDPACCWRRPAHMCLHCSIGHSCCGRDRDTQPIARAPHVPTSRHAALGTETRAHRDLHLDQMHSSHEASRAVDVDRL